MVGQRVIATTVGFGRHGVVGVGRENQEHIVMIVIMLPAPFFGVCKPLFGRKLKKRSSSVKPLPKQQEKLFSRMSPCSQSLVESSHLVLGVGLARVLS